MCEPARRVSPAIGISSAVLDTSPPWLRQRINPQSEPVSVLREIALIVWTSLEQKDWCFCKRAPAAVSRLRARGLDHVRSADV